MNFVWTYWDGGAAEDELRWSIRSIRQNFLGDVKITVVGDPPPWYHGHVIFKPRIPECRLHNWQDVISKMEVISTHPEIDGQFFWLADDVYLINPCDFNTLSAPRCDFTPLVTYQKHKKWNKLRRATLTELGNRNYSTHDYATHLPQPIIQSELRKVFHDFDIRQPLLWEIIYGNLFRKEPVDCFPFLHRQATPVTIDDANTAASQSFVLNHGNRKGWTPELRQWLSERFPVPAPEELSS